MNEHPARKRRRPTPQPVEARPDEPTAEEAIRDGLRALDRQEFDEATRLFKLALAKAPFRADVKELLALSLERRSHRGEQPAADTPKFTPVRAATAAAWSAPRRASSWALGRRLFAPVVAVVVVIVVFLGARQVRHWRAQPPPPSRPVVESADVVRTVDDARDYARSGRYDEAIRALEDALRRSPAAPEPIRQLEAEYRNQQGVIMREKSDYASAIGYFRQALELAPDNAEYLYDLAMALHLRGRQVNLTDKAKSEEYETEARQRFEASLRIIPNGLDALHGLSRAQLALGDNQGVAATCRRILEIAPPASREAQAARQQLLDLGLTAEAQAGSRASAPAEK
ncbi:MAG: tetratricopeptide repeat protein [Candidatus Sumerlaeota bacterium]|nr:tetratricopeptide repeat protein [Candidatus Sumerlaeota bacterium]